MAAESVVKGGIRGPGPEAAWGPRGAAVVVAREMVGDVLRSRGPVRAEDNHAEELEEVPEGVATAEVMMGVTSPRTSMMETRRKMRRRSLRLHDAVRADGPVGYRRITRSLRRRWRNLFA